MFVESISQRSGQNNRRSIGESRGDKEGGILFVNTSLAWSTVNRTSHTVGGRKKQPPTPAAGLGDCNRRGEAHLSMSLGSSRLTDKKGLQGSHQRK